MEAIYDESLRAQIRAEAASSPEVVEAQRKLSEIQAARQRDSEDHVFFGIFHTNVNGKVAVDGEAARGIIRGWLNPGEWLTLDWFLRVLKENPSLASRLSWTPYLNPAQRKQRDATQVEADRGVFAAACRKYSISNNEANFRLALEVVGSPLNEFAIGQALQSGALQVSPATPAEIQQWTQEAAEARVKFLRETATPEQLKYAARTEAEQRRVEFQQAEAQRQIKAREEKDAGQFDAIPEVNAVTGEKLDRTYFIKLSNTNMPAFRQAIRRWGAANVTARLNGIR